MELIIGLNLGSTSSEVGVYKGDSSIHKHKLSHSEEELSLSVEKQMPFRLKAIKDWLEGENIDLSKCTAIACRGGRLKPITSGVYPVNEELLEDSKKTEEGDHASRLSVFIGVELSKESNCPVFVVDPISVDEFQEVARISGLAGVERKSLGHALNSKYVAKKMAGELGKDYENSRFIIGHMGGGATFSLHINGQMVDMINDFEGAMTPERSGTLPMTDMLRLCGNNDIEIVSKWIEGIGGIYSYLGTKRFDVLEEKANSGDEEAKLLLEAYVYQQKKTIGGLYAVADLNLDGMALTGGIAHSKYVTEELSKVFSPNMPIVLYPGSFEMEAMIEGARNAMNGDIDKKEYPSGRKL